MKIRETKSRDRKPQFAHDENLEFARLRKDSNRYALFTPVKKLAKKEGLKDHEVMELCNKKDIHIITHNTTDFQNPRENIKIGIICVGSRIDKNWIKLFNKFLNKYPQHENLYNLNILINNEISVRNRKTGKESKI